MFNQTKKYQKVVTVLLVVVLVMPSVYGLKIKRAQAFLGVTDWPNLIQNTITAGATSLTAGSSAVNAVNTTAITTKEFLLDFIAYAVAKIFIQQLTADVVDWANNGFKGQPGFITNPDQWFGNLSDRVAGSFIQGALPGLCSPFRLRVQFALAQNYIQDYRSQCTLTEVIGNFENFTDDFYQGGWDGWFVMTQNNQNNPFGAYLDAKHELDIRLVNSQEKIEKQLEYGRGFLSWPGECLKPGVPVAVIDEETGEETGEVIPSDAPGVCVEFEQNTPGSVVESQLNNVFGSGVRQLEMADEINEIVSAVLNGLLGKLIGGIGDGLRGLTIDGDDRSEFDTVLNEAYRENDRIRQDAENDARTAQDIIDRKEEDARREAEQQISSCDEITAICDAPTPIDDLSPDDELPRDPGSDESPPSPVPSGGGSGSGGTVPLPPPPDPPGN